MSLFRTFKTDTAVEQSGFWYRDFPTNEDGTIPGFLLARAGRTNTKFAKKAEVLGRKHRRAIDMDTITGDTARAINVELFLSTVLMGWENVQEENGNDIPYTTENAKRLMEELPDLYDLLDGEAKKASNFRAAEQEDEAGN